MRCKWFEMSVWVDGGWEHFEDDNLVRLLLRVKRVKSKGKRIGRLTINFPR